MNSPPLPPRPMGSGVTAIDRQRELVNTLWSELLSNRSERVQQHLEQLIAEHRALLAQHFYDQMLTDSATSAFLSHEQVKTRLNASLQQWLVNLFAVRIDSGLQRVLDQQIHVGEVHARIDLPVHLMLRGASLLKAQLLRLLGDDSALNADERTEAMQLSTGLIDLAIEMMSHAYATSHDRNARAGEAYRLFAVAQNLSTEKERQRAALLDWENQLMFDVAIGLSGEQLPRIGSSDFGLWFRHKGADAFQSTDEARSILAAMHHIDSDALPHLDGETRESRVTFLREIRDEARAIAFHLERLFDQNTELEAGRDALTRLLNRKFLPVIMRKEIDYCRSRMTSFALLAIDIDHFKSINDAHGHEGGDAVLNQFAALLSNHCRAGDYVFRLGGEEFLVLLVDTDLGRAHKAAENLRSHITSTVFQLPRQRSLHLTASMGLALHDGHPDYQLTLRYADEALYAAKAGGRDRIVLAKASAPTA